MSRNPTKGQALQNDKPAAAIIGISIAPATGSNFTRAMRDAQEIAAQFPGAVVEFHHEAVRYTVSAGGVL